MKRDIIFLLLGTLLGIPAGMFSNYIYDWLFPNTAIVAKVGVQGLSTPQDGFYFMKKASAGMRRDGHIDVRYTQGTDTKGYSCSVSLSEPDLFEYARFSKDCRRIEFRFKDPDLLWDSRGGENAAASFDVTIKSATGQLWTGSQGIGYAYIPSL